MAGRYPRPKDGEQVKVNGRPVPFTFWPDAYYKRGRLVTSDPWACIMAHIHQTEISKTRKNLAIAFLEQAQDFHRAASVAPRLGSKPVLHYYSFLNLAKVYLALWSNHDLKKCIHGLNESHNNIRSHLTITSQSITIPEQKGRLQLYREFIGQCGFPLPNCSSSTKVIDLLEQIVGIHRMTNYTLRRPTKYFPISYIRFEHNKQKKKAWITLHINKADLSDKDAQIVRKNTLSFQEVESSSSYRSYESKQIDYDYSPIKVLRYLVLSTWMDIWSELQPGGYKFWISSIDKKKRRAQLASGYQAMFYFGSVARYRPDDFYKLIEGKHGWMVQEFINTQPSQFIYFLGSGIIDAEMVPPEFF